MKRATLHLSVLTGFALYCFFIEQANKPVAGTLPSVAIEGFGPKTTIAGKAFNVQYDGKSALWFRTRGQLKKRFKVVWQQTPLETVVRPKQNLVTAVVPEWLFASPGTREIYLEDVESGVRSGKVVFEVLACGANQLGSGTRLWADALDQ